jgi:hypothetical protein
MCRLTEISRSVWSPDGKYLIIAQAKFRIFKGLPEQFIAKAVVHVFKGDPIISGASSIFSGFSNLHSSDLLDELQNAERIGRDFIASRLS